MKKANIKSLMVKENDCSNWHVAELQLKYQEYKPCTIKIGSPEDAVKVVHNSINQDEFMIQEHFYALYLNRANEVLGFRTIGSGGIKGVTISTQHILGIALLLNADSLIVFHNHPSGNLSPSDVDIKLTKELICGVNILDMSLLDHIILNKTAYNSMSSNNILDFDLKTDINQYYLKTHKTPVVEKKCASCATRDEIIKSKDDIIKIKDDTITTLEDHVKDLKKWFGLHDGNTKPQSPLRIIY